MTLRQLRFLIAVLVLGTHLGYPFWLFGMRRQYLDAQQLFEMTLMVMPVLAVSLVVVVRAMMRDEMPDDRKPVRIEKALVSIIVTLSFVVALLGVPLLYPDTIQSEETLRSSLLICDTLFGGYLGYIVDVLFIAKQARPLRSK